MTTRMTPKLRASYVYGISAAAKTFIIRNISQQLKAHDGHMVRTGPRWGVGVWEVTCDTCRLAIGVDLSTDIVPPLPPGAR